MIKYAMRCAEAHEFEGWFRSSVDFDEQQAAGALSCPFCGIADVAKAIMSPAVATGGGRDLPLAEAQRAMRELVERTRAHVEKNFEHVGARFPEEARRIHYGESEPRPIYGEATAREAIELHEEGVAVAPLPRLPADSDVAGAAKPKPAPVAPATKRDVAD